MRGGALEGGAAAWSSRRSNGHGVRNNGTIHSLGASPLRMLLGLTNSARQPVWHGEGDDARRTGCAGGLIEACRKIQRVEQNGPQPYRPIAKRILQP